MNKNEGEGIIDEGQGDQVRGNYNDVGESQSGLGRKLVNTVVRWF